MSAETIALVALAITIISNLAVAAEKIFGGGNKLAAKFASLEKESTAEITTLRIDLLEFRAKMAEEYMRRDSYYKASEELKRDFKEKHDDLKSATQEGFKRLEDQIGAVSQAIEAGRQSRKAAHA